MTRSSLGYLIAAIACIAVTTSGSANAKNIGNIQGNNPNARAQAITRILHSLIGTWKGTYSYYDVRTHKVVGGSATLIFRRMPMPNVISLDATAKRPVGPPIHALTVMVAQANGASIRQMVFTKGAGILQDKVITSYSYENASNWVMESIEVQQGLGHADAVDVEFKMKDGKFVVTKRRKFEGGEAAKMPFESLAKFVRVK